MNSKINELLNGLDNEVINNVINSANATSAEAQSAILNELTSNSAKYKKLGKALRPAAILKVVNNMNTMYPVSQVSESTVDSETPVKSKVPSWREKSLKVYQYDKKGNLIAEYSSIQAAHRASGISDSSICYCCKKKTGFKTAGGYVWSYEPISIAE